MENKYWIKTNNESIVPEFRKEISILKPLKKILSITSMGFYKVFINDKSNVTIII